MQMKQLVDEKLGSIPDREDKTRFLLERYGDTSDKSMLIYIRRFNKIGTLEQELHKNLYQFSREDFLKLFQAFTNTVANGFSVLKSFVADYFQWAETQGIKTPLSVLKEIAYDDTDLTGIYKQSYFPTFQNLKDELQMMLDLAGTEDVSVYQSVKMMVYLSWFGVENPEICGIRKQDVSDEQNELYLRERETTLILPESVMPEMREYRDAAGYYRPFHSADLTFFRYKDSPFLLRSYRKEQLSYIDVVNALKNFSRLNDDPNGKKFQYHKIYWSGVFSRAYAYEFLNGELQKGNLVLLQKVFGEDYGTGASGAQKAAGRLKEYQRFRDYLYR